MSERLTEKQVKEIRELIHEWRPFVSVLRDPLERTLLSEQAGWAEVDRLNRLVVSLQEQLRQASQCAAHWICHHHAEETRFHRQNHTLGRIRAEIAWIRKRFEAEWTYELGTGEVVLEILERLEEAAG